MKSISVAAPWAMPRRAHAYDPRRYHFWRRWVLKPALDWLGMTLFARLGDVQGLEHVPQQGPVLMYYNHIAFVDPLVILHVLPRIDVTPLAKVEAFHYPVIGIFPRMWGAIPVHRGEVDRFAIKATLRALAREEIVLIAPEGTRSPQLLRAKPGLAYFAARARVPLLPVAVEGTEGYPTWPLARRWWQDPKAQVRFGRPFWLHGPERPDAEALQRMTDEAMVILAQMLPPRRRGAYADASLDFRYARWDGPPPWA
ncbi:MAG: 1-acyl-sn-glycerol-3-phosphate acyltransferase [Chloroflexi bacterium]|nr:1-acyl-sn-glycerol-3-phosphate acyltransferase [Chloroflexota bacterium]